MTDGEKMVAHILYKIDGFEAWEITPESFAKLDTPSMKEVMVSLNDLRDSLIGIYYDRRYEERQ